MKSWQFAIVGLFCVAVPACQSNPNHTIPLLERELRLQEDEIYRLKKRLEECQQTSQVTTPGKPKTDNAGLKSLLDFSGAKRATGIDGSQESAEETPAPPTKSGEAPFWQGSASPTGDLPETLPEPPNTSAPPNMLPSLEMPNSDSQPSERKVVPSTDQTDNRQTAKVILNRQLSGGYNADGRPGDEGIVAVVEPLDGLGQAVEAPADLSLVVIDPALADDSGRVARWDFSAAETAGLFGLTDRSGGMQLQLNWPNGPPMNPDVRLFVRYTTADGRQLQADMPMRINLAGENAMGWVPTKPSEPPTVANPILGAAAARIPTPHVPSGATSRAPAMGGDHPPQQPKTASRRPQWSPNR